MKKVKHVNVEALPIEEQEYVCGIRLCVTLKDQNFQVLDKIETTCSDIQALADAIQAHQDTLTMFVAKRKLN